MKPLATTLMVACLTIGCSGARAKDETRMPSAYANDPAADPSDDSSMEEGDLQLAKSEVVMTKDESPEVLPPPQEPVPAPAPVQDPPEAVAQADLQQVDGSTAAGTITFAQSKGRVTIAGNFSGLKPGLHGFQIHEKGNCQAKAKRAGKHFNPTKAKHGPPESSQRHAGDFGNLIVDENGVATFAMTTDSITVAAGPDSVVGLAIVIHARKDDGKTQPTGNDGPAVACGVIEMKPEVLAGQ